MRKMFKLRSGVSEVKNCEFIWKYATCVRTALSVYVLVVMRNILPMSLQGNCVIFVCYSRSTLLSSTVKESLKWRHCYFPIFCVC